MMIKDYISPPLGTIAPVAEKITKALDIFDNKIDDPSYSPVLVIRDTVKVLKNLEKEWSECNNHTVKVGRKTNQILIKSLCYFTIDNYILAEFKYKIHHKKDTYKRLKYVKDKLQRLAYLSTILLFMKYKEVYEFEIRYCVYALLLEYFTLYNEIGDWFFTSQDIEDVISGVLSSEFIVLHPYQAYINRFLDKEESEEIIKTKNEKTTDKPQSIYDLLALQPYENSSKQDWYSAIMRHYRVSRRTVYNWLHQFGCEDDIRTYQYNSPHNKNKTKKELIEALELAYKKIEELTKMIENLHKN